MERKNGIRVNLRIIFNAIKFHIKERRNPNLMEMLAFRLKKPSKKERIEWNLKEEE